MLSSEIEIVDSANAIDSWEGRDVWMGEEEIKDESQLECSSTSNPIGLEVEIEIVYTLRVASSRCLRRASRILELL